jgi:hypothetical protein
MRANNVRLAVFTLLAIIVLVDASLFLRYRSSTPTNSDFHPASQETTGGGSGAAECTGKHVYSGANLVNVAASNPPGSTFCIHDGRYSVSNRILLQSGDSFIGLYSDGSRPVISTTQAREIFDGLYNLAELPKGSPPYVADGVRIEGLRITGAVGGERCSPECGRGIGGGKNLTVVDVRSDHNANQGIGGAQSGLLIDRSVIDHNGSEPFLDFDGVGSAAGVKAVESMTIRNTRVYANVWTGIWCDLGCAPFTVENVTSSRNGMAGLQYERSHGPATISNSTFKGNGWLEHANRHTGIVINAARNLEVYGNTFGGNIDHAVEIIDHDREPGLADVSIHDNALNGDKMEGCGIVESVTCADNIRSGVR